MLPHGPLCVSLVVIVCGKLPLLPLPLPEPFAWSTLFCAVVLFFFFSALASNFINHANAYRPGSSNSSSSCLLPASVYLQRSFVEGTTSSRLCGSRNRARNLSAFSRKLCECENLRLHDHPVATVHLICPGSIPLPRLLLMQSVFAICLLRSSRAACLPVIMLM